MSKQRPFKRKSSGGPVCIVCSKTVYPTRDAALSAALRASRYTGDALRIYVAHGGLHLTKTRTNRKR